MGGIADDGVDDVAVVEVVRGPGDVAGDGRGAGGDGDPEGLFAGEVAGVGTGGAVGLWSNGGVSDEYG